MTAIPHVPGLCDRRPVPRPGPPLVVLLARRRARRRVRLVSQLWRRRATVRFTRIDLLDRVAPSRPGWRRHVIAILMLLGLTAGVVAIARPVAATTERTASEGRILLLFDVSLSMMATYVAPTRPTPPRRPPVSLSTRSPTTSRSG